MTKPNRVLEQIGHLPLVSHVKTLKLLVERWVAVPKIVRHHHLCERGKLLDQPGVADKDSFETDERRVVPVFEEGAGPKRPPGQNLLSTLENPQEDVLDFKLLRVIAPLAIVSRPSRIAICRRKVFDGVELRSDERPWPSWQS